MPPSILPSSLAALRVLLEASVEALPLRHAHARRTQGEGGTVSEQRKRR